MGGNRPDPRASFYRRLLCALLCSLCLGSFTPIRVPAAEPETVWATRFAGQGYTTGKASAVDMDGAGNVYVSGFRGLDALTGYGMSEIVTMKYDPDGNELWTAGFSGLNSQPVSMVVDALGNVYVTGQSDAQEGNALDYVTVKYDTEGTQLWVARYDGPGHGDDQPAAVAVDVFGHVYVTGHSDRVLPDEFNEYATIKYDADGNQLWAARFGYETTGGHQAFAKGLALDGSGDLYVTGRYDGDCTTIKYDPEGNPLWMVRYDGPRFQSNYEASDTGYRVAVDASGNVVVSGISSFMDRRRLATLKYTPDGNEIWRAEGEEFLCQTTEYTKLFTLLATDAWGNIYIGRSIGYPIIKYGPDGTRLWVGGYENPVCSADGPATKGLAVAADGSVFFLGTHALSNTYPGEAITIKFDSDGNELWADHYTGPTGRASYATALALSAAGEVSVVGMDYFEFFARKYDTVGNPLWTAFCPRFLDPGTSADDRVSSMAVDSEGNVVVTGTSVEFSGGQGFTGDMVTIKYGAYGAALWTARYDEPGRNVESANEVALDATGNVHVLGSVGMFAKMDYATLKYDPDGSLLWAARYDGPEGNMDQPAAMALDPLGNVLVTGTTAGTGYCPPDASSYDYATVKYDPDGNLLWEVRRDGGSGESDRAKDIAVDALGNVYVTGGSDPDGAYLTIKYDASGNEIWASRHEQDGTAGASLIALDARGNVYVSGGTGVYPGAYITVKYDADGNELWAATLNRGYGLGALIVDGQGNVHLSGTGASPEPGISYSFLTAKYDPDGNLLWSVMDNLAGSGSDNGTCMVLDPEGNVLVSGKTYIEESSRFATIKYDPDGVKIWEKRYDISAYKVISMGMDGRGDIYVSGLGPTWIVGEYDYLTVKYTESPVQGWGLAAVSGPGAGPADSPSSILNYLWVLLLAPVFVLAARRYFVPGARG